MPEAHLGVKVFERYFEKSFWANKDGSSGPNSAYDQTHKLRKNLEDLLIKYNIQSLYDAGCGDANLIYHMSFSTLKTYVGIECVAGLTEKNRIKFAKHTLSESLSKIDFSFQTGDLLDEKLKIPTVDLILSRDVLHYWPNAFVPIFLNKIKASASKYFLATHNLYSHYSANSETEFGIFRPVDLTQSPFEIGQPIEIILEDTWGKALALYDLSKIKIK